MGTEITELQLDLLKKTITKKEKDYEKMQFEINNDTAFTFDVRTDVPISGHSGEYRSDHDRRYHHRRI